MKKMISMVNGITKYVHEIIEFVQFNYAQLLSYKKEDRPRAKIIVEALEQHGYSVWWDCIIPPGKTFAQVIKESLDAAKCVMVLWSRQSVSADWVNNEAAEGAKRRIIIPVLIDDVEIPFEFRRIQAARLVDWQETLSNPEFDLLLNSIREILGQPAAQKMEIKKASINELSISAGQLLKEGKYSEAIEKFQKVIEIDPNHADAYYGWGIVLLTLGRFEEAIEKFQKVIKIDPNHADAYYSWGGVLLTLGRFEEAIEKFQKVIKIDPNHAAVYNMLGFIFSRLNKHEGAIMAYQKAIELYRENGQENDAMNAEARIKEIRSSIS
ncbi:MAG: toll/interleukin-1 receptor domain-containing protein [ANME-2 cluster archaeon]|nr:MAG: toll/interleukin-1 receptor domain-containing protein [ANME-2 cluster archaeon]